VQLIKQTQELPVPQTCEVYQLCRWLSMYL